MNIKTILSYLLVLILGSGIGFFVGSEVNKSNAYAKTNKSSNKILNEDNYLDWTHVDLLKYFQEKGLNFEAKKTQYGSLWGAPMDYKSVDGDVYVRLHETVAKSKSNASNLGTKGFSWGKFMFKSENEELLKNISSILDNKFNDDYEFLKTVIAADDAEISNRKENILKIIKLEKIVTGYYTGRRNWAPSAVLTFKNISNQDITQSVAIEVVFFDEDENEQLSAETKHLIGFATNTRLAAGNSSTIQFASDLGWNIIPFGKRITAKIYIEKKLIETVEINEIEISSLGRM